MIAGFRAILVKFGLFALVAVLLGALLVNTMVNGLPRGAHGYSAEFTDVSGLRVGDDVRVAGVRVGRVQAIDVHGDAAEVRFDLVKGQRLLDTTKLVMRYQNLLGQRYLAMVQQGAEGSPLKEGATVPLTRTSPGFDLTELLNGFRPLFEALRPDDINKLATSLVKVLQGEGGTVSSLLAQTSRLTSFLADRDQVYGQVVTNLTPVLQNLAGQGTELQATVKELRALMTGLAKERQSIGASIDGMSTLIGSTSQLLAEVRGPLVVAVKRFRATMELFMRNKVGFVEALKSFRGTLASLGRMTSYENAANIYLCSLTLDFGGGKANLAGGTGGPWSEVCR